MNSTFKEILLNFAYPILKKVNRFEGIHKGESCYLIGDGISLKWFDLKHFSDKISIPVGYIHFHNESHFLKMPYALLVEPYWFYPLVKTTKPPVKRIRNHVQERYREIIKKNKSTEFFLNLSNFPVIRDKNVTYLFRDIPGTTLVKHFLDRGVDPFHGSLRASIFMAIYMGFDSVYLLGYDYTHSPSRILHWYEKGMGITKDNPEYQKDFFDIARKLITIKTVTVDGVSEKLEYITYKQLTGHDPAFRENSELLAMKYLKSLSTWNNYNIF